MRRTVLLRHDLDDGSYHFDWMIEPLEGAPLITFRVHDRIDSPAQGAFDAERIGVHRQAYLDYEGPISNRGAGGGGRVQRMASGVVTACNDDQRSLLAEIDWGAGARLFSGARSESPGSWWRFDIRIP